MSEYMVHSRFHGDGKIVAAYINDASEAIIDILFPNSKALQQRKPPIATFPLLQAVKEGNVISRDPKISNEVLCVQLTKIAESGTMPRYSEKYPPVKNEPLLFRQSIHHQQALNSFRTKNGYHSHCFTCGNSIDSNVHIKCEICGWYICADCGACKCSYNERT